MTAIAIPTANLALAERHKWVFTAAAAATGAIPVPAASAAICGETAVMINAIASAMGIPVSLKTVTLSMGKAMIANQIGRAVFVEAARALGWFAGPLGVAGVSALGATTAALQTWLIAELTIAICKSGGRVLTPDEARQVIEEGEESFDFDAIRRRATTSTVP